MKTGLLIKNGRLITDHSVQADAAVGIRAGRITYVGSTEDVQAQEYSEVFDANGKFIGPGLIDSHTHGGVGYDFLTASENEIERLLSWYASNGVTAVLPTLSAGLKEGFLGACRTLSNVCRRKSPAAKILGLNIEGPFINKEKKGAQPYDEENPVDVSAVGDYLGYFKDAIRVMTLAPEIEGGLELIDALRKNGVLCSVGHSNATYSETILAVEHGLNRSTHTFNAMSQLEHHEPGIVGAVMASEKVYAEITLDGFHVHPGAAKALVNAKGLKKIVLITDSIQATGLGDGSFVRPGNRHIVVKDNVARLGSGSLAGSVLTLNRAVANAVQFLGLSIDQAVNLASDNVAKSLSLENEGSIKEGNIADIIIHDERMNVLHTIVDGQFVFDRI